jgi:haloalkane dehalogenase
MVEIPRHLYPFDGRFFDRGQGLRMHYLDEGTGEPVVMVHGNPTWSFYFRNLVTDLRKDHRVIAPDHLGMGLSDRPGDDRYRYTLASRVDDLEALLEHAGVRGNITLIVHDWGGMIGMAYATRYPDRIRKIVLLNTAAFPLPPSKAFPWPLRLARDLGLGASLVQHHNAFARVAARVCVTRAPLSAEVRAAYLAPYEQPGTSLATLRFVQDIPLGPRDPAFALLQETSSRLGLLADRPILIGWGGRDFVFDQQFLAVWRAIYPAAQVDYYPDSGHYILEDEAATLGPRIGRFVRGEDA